MSYQDSHGRQDEMSSRFLSLSRPDHCNFFYSIHGSISHAFWNCPDILPSHCQPFKNETVNSSTMSVLSFVGAWVFLPGGLTVVVEVGMEPDAVAMILMQASKLHERFDDTIEKAKARNSQAQTKNAAAAAADDSSSEEEVKSLSSIRDALEVLEDQLDCLQILQRQQQADKEAALSDLEESRKIFLERLRRHNGRSWAVVKDAFAFAGEAEVDGADRHQKQNQNQNQNENEEAANTAIPGKDEDDEDGKPSTVNMVAMKSLEWSENNGGKKKIEEAMSSQRPGGMLHTIIMRAASFTVVGFGLMVLLSFNRRKINKARRCRSEEDDDVIGSVSIKNYE